MASERSEAGTGKSPKVMAALAVAIAAFAVYGNSLLNGFVYDDKFQILENPWVKDAGHVGAVFSEGVWAFRGSGGNYYRPMMHLVNRVNYRIFGPRAWAFHLTNVVLHAGISVLVFLLACRLLEAPSRTSVSVPALAAAAVFALHPIHTEAVSWSAGLPDLLFTLFFLLSLQLYARSTVGGRIGSPAEYALSVVSFFLAALSKEPALTLPAVLLAYDFAFLGPAAFRRFGELARRHLPFVAIAVVYLALRVNALGGFAPLRAPGWMTVQESLPNLPPLFLAYLGKLILPTNLNAYYEFHPVSSWLAPKALLSATATAGLLAVSSFLALRGKRKIFFYLSTTALPLLPVLAIWAIPGSKFCERYLYLPAFGFAMLVALAVEHLRRTSRIGAAVAALAVGSTLTLYAVSTVRRNEVWRDEYSLWSDTVKKSPGSADVQSNLGAAYGERGFTDEAIEHYTIALELNSDQPDIHDNLGTAYLEKGWQTRAEEQFRMALQLAPGHVSANAHMGDVYEQQGLPELAIERYQIALKSRPNSSLLHDKLGVAYGKQGRLEDAVEELRWAVHLDPDSVKARNNLGVAYAMMNLPDEAIEQLEHALAISPEGVETLLNLSRVYAMKGMREESESYLQRAQAAQDRGMQ